MAAKPIKSPELRYPVSQLLLIIIIITVIFSDGTRVQERSSNRTAGTAGRRATEKRR